MVRRRRITWLDVVLAAAILAGGAWLVWRVNVGLNYNWNWPVIGQYLIRYDDQAGRWVPNLLLQGLATTIRLSVWATLLAALWGGAMGLARISPRLFRRLIGQSYVGLIRNLPPLVLVFLFFYFLSDQIIPLLDLETRLEGLSPGWRTAVEAALGPIDLIPAFLSAVATLALYEGAYITEIVRAGVESIDRGQWEAAAALGMNRLQQLRHVVGPQAVRRILPPLAGQFISTIKDSAIVSVISIPELTFQGTELMAATYLRLEVWITVTGLYLVLTLTLSLAVEKIFAGFRNDNGGPHLS